MDREGERGRRVKHRYTEIVIQTHRYKQTDTDTKTQSDRHTYRFCYIFVPYGQPPAIFYMSMTTKSLLLHFLKLTH